MKAMTIYEKKTLDEIHGWKHPETGLFGKMIEYVNKPIDKVGELVLKTPGVEYVIEKAVEGIIGLTNDAAQWSVRPNSIYREYRGNGSSAVRSPKDIFRLDLEQVDTTIGYLGAKYKSIAFIEGTATGAAGAPGIALDIPAIITLNLRAIGEYATYCGFDVQKQQERLFAMNVLALASSPKNSSKAAAMAQLVKIAKDVARKKPWKDLEKYTFVKVIEKIAETLGIRLTKAKLGQVIPVAGAAVGGGYNAWYTSRVCEASYNLYRERFLAEKYGQGIIGK